MTISQAFAVLERLEPARAAELERELDAAAEDAERGGDWTAYCAAVDELLRSAEQALERD